MKSPTAMMALILTALLWSQAGVASGVTGGPAAAADYDSDLIEPSQGSSVKFDGSTDKNQSKLRAKKKKCSKNDKDCKDG